ncbi:MAG: hypothetical protein ACKPE6_14440, partial [Gammaproteobacteria bacterium]
MITVEDHHDDRSPRPFSQSRGEHVTRVYALLATLAVAGALLAALLMRGDPPPAAETGQASSASRTVPAPPAPASPPEAPLHHVGSARCG